MTAPGPALPPLAASQPDLALFPPHQVTESETRAGALQHSLDQLKLSLAKAADSESCLKEKVQGLTATLSESQTSSASAQEKLLQLQKALAAGAHEQRVLQVGAFWAPLPAPSFVKGGPLLCRERWAHVFPPVSLQERLDAARQALLEAKKQNGAFSERLQALKGQRAELELQKEELEGLGRQQEEASGLTPAEVPWFCSPEERRSARPAFEVRVGRESSRAFLKRGFCSRGQEGPVVPGNSSSRALFPFPPPAAPRLQLLRQRQEGEAVALRKLQKAQEDRRLLQERLASLQKALAQLESEKREAERLSLRLEKEKSALRRTLDKGGGGGGSQRREALGRGGGWEPRAGSQRGVGSAHRPHVSRVFFSPLNPLSRRLCESQVAAGRGVCVCVSLCAATEVWWAWQVEREKLKTHEDAVRLSVEKGRLDRSLTGAELELVGAQQQIRQLEVRVIPGPGGWPAPRIPPPSLQLGKEGRRVCLGPRQLLGWQRGPPLPGLLEENPAPWRSVLAERKGEAGE